MASTSAQAGPSRPRATPQELHALSPEIIIIGAGIAGSALAFSLANAGRQVLLLERDLSEPDRIVGELLQPGGVAALHHLGLGKCLEGIDATPVEGYCVCLGERRVRIPYPLLDQYVGDSDTAEVDKLANGNGYANGNGHAIGRNGYLSEKAFGDPNQRWHVQSMSGQKEGRSFHHGRLINSLRQACLDSDNLTVLEATVRELVFCEHTNRVIGVSAAFKPAQESDSAPAVVKNIYAPLTIVADGLFSKFRTAPGLRLPTPKLKSHFVGVILKDVSLPMERYGTVCLTPNGPVLLYQIGYEAREIRMLVDVAGKLPSVGDGSLKQHILDHYLPHLPLELHDAVRSALDTQRLRTMPNSFLPPSQQASGPASLQGAILVGDAYNMRHPLTGGGMTVAFADAVLLTKYLSPQEDLPAGREGLEDWGKIAEKVRKWFWERKHLSAVVNILSIALYDLFGGANEDLAILREGCFQYFELGGEAIGGPVGLLSGLTPRPMVLFMHFFAVAFYAIWTLLKRGPPKEGGLQEKVNPAMAVLELPYRLFVGVRVFWTACVVILPVIWSELQP